MILNFTFFMHFLSILVNLEMLLNMVFHKFDM